MIIETINKVIESRSSGLSFLDSIIFNREDWDMMEPMESLDLRISAIKESVRHHISNCKEYASFANRMEFDPEKIMDPQDLYKIPQIPSSIFKMKEIVSVPQKNIVKRFESSGTSGVKSKIARDEISLARLSGSLRGSSHVWDNVIGNLDLEEDIKVIHLGPPRQEAGSIWFSNVMGLIELEADTNHVMRNGKIDWKDVKVQIISALKDFKRVIVVGAPFLVKELSDTTHFKEINGGEKLCFVTGGGWKKFSGSPLQQKEMIDEAFQKFQLRHRHQFKDVFNQVELNCALVECSEGKLHAPPWLEIIVRDPFSLNAMDAGKEGILSYLDPTAHSFPCFFIGEDIGIKNDSPCKCGRTTHSISITRRLKISSHHGCSLQLAKDYFGDNNNEI
ncbi:hypothetical protein [Leptospira santarosai]|uniref:LuxE/PaaK family acyltransferase n=1 Tax=Leptospira santarosai TaxID=28183 RepID=UPI00037BE3CB|nr:hypothetical protein [Leptospira santarosai]MDI7191034.1 acyl-protein synthetase LuxE [Leptospira santarosai]MDI7208434.1 acyl-protein synthetase LuxE [Leptospira santarosai]MDI7215531.1 acyl-protein synthetase LuxE [Leptospira santarosai]MDI7237945.1 acyl-protein synthetase LuxE [Leptospira santarosai]